MKKRKKCQTEMKTQLQEQVARKLRLELVEKFRKEVKGKHESEKCKKETEL